MMWLDIAQDHLKAARLLARTRPRSAASRSYYAAHCLLTHSLCSRGYVVAGNRQTPPHREQPRLVRQFLGMPKLAFLLTRLYARRIDADYNCRATVNAAVAMDSLRDAHELFRLLKVKE